MAEVFKTVYLVTMSLTFLATVAMFCGYAELAGVAVGGLAGWIGGNLNGRRETTA